MSYRLVRLLPPSCGLFASNLGILWSRICRCVPPVFNSLCSVHKVLFATDIVTVKNSASHVPGDSHCGLLRNSSPNHITNRRATEVMQQNRDLGGFAHIGPSNPEVSNRTTILPGEQCIVRLLALHARRKPLVDIFRHSDGASFVVLRGSRQELNRAVFQIHLAYPQTKQFPLAKAEVIRHS